MTDEPQITKILPKVKILGKSGSATILLLSWIGRASNVTRGLSVFSVRSRPMQSLWQDIRYGLRLLTAISNGKSASRQQSNAHG